MHGTRLLALLICTVLLAGCAGTSGPVSSSPQARRYSDISCVSFARELTGLQLRGDAADWWEAANGRYARSSHPEMGAILVFRRSRRLPSGHVAVVSRVLGARSVDVIQANWVPGELDQDQLVVDVSQRNDWTAVRVWWPPNGALGKHVYPADGFILLPAPRTHESLAGGAEPAAERAARGG
jgi:surface antigen